MSSTSSSSSSSSSNSSSSSSSSSSGNGSKLRMVYNTGRFWPYYYYQETAFIFQSMTYAGTQVLNNPGNTAYNSDTYCPGIQFVNAQGVIAEIVYQNFGTVSNWVSCEILDDNGNVVTGGIGGNGNGGPQGAAISAQSPTYIWTFYDPADQNTSPANGTNYSNPICTFAIKFVQTYDEATGQDILSLDFTIDNLGPYFVNQFSFPLYFGGTCLANLNWSGQSGPVANEAAVVDIQLPGGASVGLFPVGGDIYCWTEGSGSVNIYTNTLYNLSPSATDTFTLQLRFGPAGTGLVELAGPSPNYYDLYRDAHPLKLAWQDRRIVSQNYVSGSGGDFIGGIFKGFWDASTNNPPLASGIGTNTDFYIVAKAGTTNLDGSNNWQVGNIAQFSNTSWGAGEYGIIQYYPIFVGLTTNGTYNFDPRITAPSTTPTLVIALFEFFRIQLLISGQSSAAQSASVNAQCCITWDIEGEASYIIGGLDPYVGAIDQAYLVTPALSYVSPNQPGYSSGARLTVMQEYFNCYTAVGVKPGVCIRAQRFYYNNGYNLAHDYGTADSLPGAFDTPPFNIPYTGGPIPVRLQSVIDQITYGKELGIYVYYMDSAGDLTGSGIHYSWFEIVTAAHPDVLICPEGGQAQVTNGTYRTMMPYKEVRTGGFGALTPLELKYIWPTSGCMLLTNGGGGYDFEIPPNDVPSGLYNAVLAEAAGGSILLTQNFAPVQAVYESLPSTLALTQPPSDVADGSEVELAIDAAYTVGNVNVESTANPPVTYTWSTTASGATFTPNGTNAAQNTTLSAPNGIHHVTCTVAVGALTTTYSKQVAVGTARLEFTQPIAYASKVGAVIFSVTAGYGGTPPSSSSGTTGIAYTWSSVTGGYISFLPNGIAAAQTTVGTFSGLDTVYTLQVLASDGVTDVTETFDIIWNGLTALAFDSGAYEVALEVPPMFTVGTDDNESNLVTYAWSTTTNTDTVFADNHTHTARNTTATVPYPGNYVFNVVANDGTNSATYTAAPVTVSEVPSSSSLSSHSSLSSFSSNSSSSSKSSVSSRSSNSSSSISSNSSSSSKSTESSSSSSSRSSNSSSSRSSDPSSQSSESSLSSPKSASSVSSDSSSSSSSSKSSASSASSSTGSSKSDVSSSSSSSSTSSSSNSESSSSSSSSREVLGGVPSSSSSSSSSLSSLDVVTNVSVIIITDETTFPPAKQAADQALGVAYVKQTPSTAIKDWVKLKGLMKKNTFVK
jgi:hypothetical protein